MVNKTHLYQRSLQLVALTKTFIDKLPVGFGFLTDQIRRASSSVVLNFAEGCSRTSKKERLRYFMIARGSVFEIAAIFDVAKQFKIIDQKLYLQGQDLCDHVSALLFRYR
ncbi:MAG: four helix bundle protein [Candidatus Uhrbacteria bacterium]